MLYTQEDIERTAHDFELQQVDVNTHPKRKQLYNVTLQHKRTWQTTSVVIQAITEEVASFLAKKYYGIDYKITKISKVR